MPKFFYVAQDSAGKKSSGSIEGSTQEEATKRLADEGLTVGSLIPVHSEDTKKTEDDSSIKIKPTKMHGGIKSEDLVLFCRQLATLLGAGITILRSLQIVEPQISSKILSEAIKVLKKDMEAGLSFHKAMAKHPKVFSDLWVNLVESGEASGNLAAVLGRLASFLERGEQFKSKIISALTYPIILLTAGIGALLFMMLKILPTFMGIFQGFGMELPALTMMLMNISDFLRTKFLFIILGGGGAIYGFKAYVKTPMGRRNFEKLQFSLPVVGEFFRAVTMERFTSNMATLLESGVPILYALEISEHSVGNVILGDIIRTIKDDVREGKGIAKSMTKSGFFDGMTVQMIGVGEEIGELPAMFKKINSFYEDYSATFLERVVAMFEPLIMVFLGGVIGTMVIGMFLPIFQLSNMGG